MGKIFCLMGKSACGKDTIYKRLLTDTSLALKTLVPYTTRPIRDGETDGVEYYFLTEKELAELEAQGKIMELRSYHTIHGIWKYFTVNDHQINLEENNYLIIGTLESYLKLKNYFGENILIPLYIELESGERLQRALDRERIQSEPKYAELCRRFLADEEDFSEKNLFAAGISKFFINDSLDRCTEELTHCIKENVSLKMEK
ncbi:MAG: guanylate kinase [Lachnospiraceae bacterium]|nr:guanylate kinase [Lachnospiraceae bacterium]